MSLITRNTKALRNAMSVIVSASMLLGGSQMTASKAYAADAGWGQSTAKLASRMIGNGIGIGSGGDTTPSDEDEYLEVVHVRYDANDTPSLPALGHMGATDIPMDGTVHSLRACTYERAGHEFAGWSLTKDGKEVPCDDAPNGIIEGFLVPDGQEMVDLCYDEPDTGTPRSLSQAVMGGELTLYAQWAPVSDDAEGQDDSQDASAKDASPSPASGKSDESTGGDSDGSGSDAATSPLAWFEGLLRGMPAPSNGDIPRQADGTNIEGISVSWVTEDTVDNGDDSLLYVKSEDDLAQSVKMKVHYALSGEHDYRPGDITITVPAHMFSKRGTSPRADVGDLEIPFPEEPKTSSDFMWSRVGETYVLTNTHSMSAATKGFIEFRVNNITPHKLVDMETSDPFWARIELVTHAGTPIGLTSNEIRAQFDTEEQVVAAHKWGYSSNVRIVDANDIPSSAHVGDETEYVVVTWGMDATVRGNTEFSLVMDDHKTDSYTGKIISPAVGDTYHRDVFTGYDGGNADGTSTVSLGYTTVEVAYPLTQFAPGTTYTFQNQVRYTLTEADPALGSDPQLVTERTADASIPWSWREPQFVDPQGHFMVNKVGNDGEDGNDPAPWYSHPYQTYYSSRMDIGIHNRDDYYGIYPSALNEFADGGDVDIAYTVESIGYILPWTLDGDPRQEASYGRKPVTMVTYDTDDTSGLPFWLYGMTEPLALGIDYEYEAVEFPKKPAIGLHVASNLNPDGSFAARHAGDGTFVYGEDDDDSHIPDVTLQANVGGTWQDVATASWSSGSLVLTPQAGIGTSGCRVTLPAGTQQIRTTVTSTNAYIWYYIRPIVTLHASGIFGNLAQGLFAQSDTPSVAVYNTTYMKAFDSDDNEIVDIHKDAMDSLQGYKPSIRVMPGKTGEQVGTDYGNETATVHYEATVEERSHIPSIATYEQAVADGEIVPDTQGVFYDLLPKGMTPVMTTIRLREGDSIEDAYTVEDYKGSGRTLLVVKASLTPTLQRAIDTDGTRRVKDVLRMEFDAVYPLVAIRDYGENPHNIIAYESLVRSPLGDVTDYGAEPDDPTSANNIQTQYAFAEDAEKVAMAGLDPSNTGNRFVYAGVSVPVSTLSAARTSLSKLVDVNGEGIWTTGTYYGHREENARDVYEGGRYAYRLRMMSDDESRSKNLVMYDSLENYQAVSGNDEVDVNAPRWRGTLLGIDTRQLVAMGVKPVIYYSTVDSLQLSDETNPNEANATNTDLTNGSIWTREDQYSGDLSAVHAIAIDCSKAQDDSDFVLQPMQSVMAIVNMHAPYGEPARGYIADDAHAYNNAYLLCTSQSVHPGGSDSTKFVRHDYTKVGLREFKLTVTKEWDDDDDRDGIRPQSVTVRLLANEEDTGQRVTLTRPNWMAEFDNIPYTDGEGIPIHYRMAEDVPSGYVANMTGDGTNFLVRNRHVPEMVTISGHKTWVGGEGYLPSSITVDLVADGTVVQSAMVTPDIDGSWDWSFVSERYRDHGTEIQYSVAERNVDPEWVVSHDGYDMTNTWHPYGDIRVSKEVTGQTAGFANTRFDLVIQLTDGNGEALLGRFPYVTSDGRTGTMGHDDTISLAGGESALISEIPHGTSYSVFERPRDGYAMDARRSSGRDGTVVANAEQAVTIWNKYSASTDVNLTATKVLTGRTLKRYQFKAELLDAVDGSVLRTATNKADGSITFGALHYTEKDVRPEPYEYVIQEAQLGNAGYTYDTARYKAYVSLADNGDGTLSKTVTYTTWDGETVTAPTFHNEYHASGSVRLRAWKQLKGRDLTDGEFDFELLNEGGRRCGFVVHNDGDGLIQFPELLFTERDAGHTYRYVAHEIAGDDATVNYDGSSYGYQISVVDNGDGTLSFTQSMADVTGSVQRASLKWDDVDEEGHRTYLWHNESPSKKGYVYAPSYESILDVPEFGLTEDDLLLKSQWGSFAVLYDITKSLSDVGMSINTAIPYAEYQALVDAQVWSGYHGGYAIIRLKDSGVSKLASAGVTIATNYGGNAILFANSNTSPEIAERRLLDYREHVMALDYTEDAFSVSSDSSDVVPVFMNTLRPGSLRIEKHVDEVPWGHEDDRFRFRVQLTGEGIGDISEASYEHAQTAGGAGVALVPIGNIMGLIGERIGSLLAPTVAYADMVSWTQYTDNGSDIEWMIDDDGNLLLRPISGDSGVLRYNADDTGTDAPPWASSPYLANITSVGAYGSTTIECQGAMASLCQGMTGLTSANLDGLDITGITSLYYAFAGCTSLTSIDWHGRAFGSLTNLEYAFDGCTGLQAINFSGMDLRAVSALRNLFSNCSSIEQVDFSGSSLWTSAGSNASNSCFYQAGAAGGFDVDCRNVTIGCMFDFGYSNLANLDFTGANTTNMTSKSNGYWFYQCHKLESIDLHGLDFSNATCQYMFYDNRTTAPFSVDMRNVNFGSSNMSSLFCDSNVGSIDLRGADFSNETSIYSIISHCHQLHTLNMRDIHFDSLQSWGQFIYDSGDGARGSVLDMSGVHFGANLGMSDMLYNSNFETLVLDNAIVRSGRTYQWLRYFRGKNIRMCGIQTSSVYDMGEMFYECNNLRYVETQYLDTSNALNFDSMFAYDSSLESLDVSTFDMSQAQSMSAMFTGCSSLKSLDLTSFSPSGKNVSWMFGGDSSLEVIYTQPNADWAATNNSGNRMFTNCAALVGGNGTAWSSGDIGIERARVDGLVQANGNPNTSGYFTAPLLSLRFDANGGTGYMVTVNYVAGNAMVIPDSLFRRFDHHQTGWVDGDGNEYALGATIPANTYADNSQVTLSAVWEQDDDVASVTDGAFEVVLGANESATFPGIPAGTTYQVYEESSSGWVLVSQSGTSGNVPANDVVTASFTNRYDEAHTTAQIVGIKTLDGRSAEAGKFQFELREDGRLIEAVDNVAGGGVVFSPMEYGEGDVGTHVYTVEEIEGHDSGIVYDTHREVVTVEVTQSDANLSAVVSYDRDGIRFANTTLPGSIQITKQVEGGGDPDQEFEFEIELRNTDISMLQGESASGGRGLDVLGWLVDGIRGLLSPQVAYADVAWNTYTDNGSSIKWRANNGVLEIAPISGDRGVLKYNTDDLGANSPPWWSASSCTSVRVTSGIIECQGSMSYMFNNSNASSIDLTQFDWSGVTSLYQAFRGSKLTSIDFRGCDLSNVRSMYNMLASCPNLRTVNLKGVSIKKCETIYDMCQSCSVLSSVDMSDVEAPMLSDMQWAFQSCPYLTYVTMKDSVLTGLTNPHGCIGGGTGDEVSRTDVIFDGVKFGTSLYGICYNCTGNLYVSFVGADTSHVTNAKSLCNYNSALRRVDMHDLDLSSCTSMEYAFNYCSNRGGQAPEIDLSGVKFGETSLTHLCYSMGSNSSNYCHGGFVDLHGADLSRVTDITSAFTTCNVAVINLSGTDLSNLTNSPNSYSSTFYWSGGQYNSDGTKLDLSEVKFGTTMNGLFNKAKGVWCIDLTNADTSHVTDMTDLFAYCYTLCELHLDGIDTSNVTSMYNMFAHCHYDGFPGFKGPMDLDLTMLETSAVTNMGFMFADAYNIKTLNVSSFDVSHVTSMDSMFERVPNLRTIYATSDTDWEQQTGLSTSGMFTDANSLVGGRGTYFATLQEQSIGMARIDGLNGEPGYFTNVVGETAVTFGTNGGTVLVGDTCSVQHDRISDVSVPTVVRNGYVLVGWNTAQDGTGTDYGTPNKVTPIVGQMLVLYAQWVPEGDAHAYQVVHRQERADTPGAYEVVGRETRHASNLNDVVVMPNSYYGFDKPDAQTVDIATDGSTTVTFDYPRKRFDVTFHLDDGTTRTQSFMGGIRQSLDRAPTVAGKRFVGWLDEENGERGFYADGQQVSFGSATDLWANYTDESNTSEMVGLDTVMHVHVKAGETVTIPNIPAGTNYVVREVNIPDGWTEMRMLHANGTVRTCEIMSTTSRNRYEAHGEFVIVAYKELEGNNLSEGQFGFELVDDNNQVVARASNNGPDTQETVPDSDGEPIPNEHLNQGEIRFNAISVDAIGTYTYHVREAEGSDTYYDYDSHTEDVTVEVTDNWNGTLTCDVAYDTDGATFINTIRQHDPNEPDDILTTGALDISKETENASEASADKQFTFDVTATDAEGRPLSGTFNTRMGEEMGLVESSAVWHTPNINQYGNKLSDIESSVWYAGALTIPGADTMHLAYDYTNVRGQFFIWEGNHIDAATSQIWTADCNPYNAVKNIVYTNNNDDNIILHGACDVNGDTITIGYSCYAFTPESCPPNNGGYNEDTNYGCYLVATAMTEPTGDAYEEGTVDFVDGHATVSIAGGQTLRIKGLSANGNYAVSEQEASGWMLRQSEGATGSIVAGDAVTASFANRYDVSGGFDIHATKQFVSRQLEDGMFSFVLTDADGDLVARTENLADGSVTFSDIPISKSWVGTTRTYHVLEEAGGSDDIVYDDHTETVTVSFADDGKGHLTGTVTYDDDGAMFTNYPKIGMPVTGREGFVASVVALNAVMVGCVVLLRRIRRQKDGDSQATTSQ